ncbi:MAG: HlyC/CorC family transporter [Candidatus Thermofonsia bacterium]|nr:MAG: HlyC/CorC family transporter [Candidatus Thermofonsia bacterium]
MDIVVIFLTVALMIFFNSLYVAAEFATVASRRTKISQMAGEGNRAAKLLMPIIENSKQLDRYVAACQLGITISSLVLGAYGQNELAPRLTSLLASFQVDWLTNLGEEFAWIIVLAFITILQVILGELLPKSLAVQRPEEWALRVVWPMKITLWLLSVLIVIFNGSANLIMVGMVRLGWLKRHPKDKETIGHSPEEIEMLVSESHEVGLLEDSERQMLRNAFRLRDLTARQVMLHRTKLVAAPITSTIRELIQLAIDEGYSRIPIYKESIDEIVGFVHIKDLFRLHIQQNDDLQSIIRQVLYVPETLPVTKLWQMLNTGRNYLAIVFDEYGGTAGLVTLEDLIEEIFGELQDEFDDEMALVARDKEGRIYLRGDLLVTDVNEYLELNLPDEADTLSGLVFSQLGRIPHEGDVIIVNEIEIRVEAMEDLGVSEVSLLLPQIDVSAPFSEWEVADHE